MKMLRYCYLLVAFLCTAGLGSARAQTFEWAKLARANVDTVRINSQISATDAAGNTYIYATFRDNLVINGTTLNAPSPGAAVMIKYDAAGAVQWFKRLQNMNVAKLAADNVTGGVFIAAAQEGFGTWDGVALPTPHDSYFYAKCSATGALQWAQPLAYVAFAGFGVVSDDAGNAYLSGIMGISGATVGGTSVNINDTFVLKIDGAGATQWVRILHGAASTYLNSIVGPKPGGGCVIAGVLRSTMYLGAGTATPVLSASSSSYNGFVTSFDAAGTHQWSVLAGSSPNLQVYFGINAVAADASGNCYVTGSSGAGFQLGSATIPSGYFLTKYDASGVVQWTRGQQNPAANSTDAGMLLAPSPQGVTVLVRTASPVTQPIVLGTLTLRTYYSFVHYTPQGAEQWAVADSRSDYSATTPITAYFAPTSMGNDALGNLYAVGRAFPRQASPTATPAVIRLGAQTTVGSGIIVTRINAYANTLRGQVYFDQNANGQKDAAEGLFPRQFTSILTQGSTTTYSAVGADGGLQAYANPGNYTLALNQLGPSYTVSQPASGGAYSGTFTGSSQVVAGLNFGIAPIANQADVRVTLTPYSRAVPGFTTRYRLTLENMGTTSASGTATATLDSHMAYISSTPAGTVAGQVITWTYSGLAPFGRLEYDILFSLPTNTVLGTALVTMADAPLTADIAPADNTTSLAQTVVGAYDPNSIEVNYQRLTPSQVAAREWLTYTIHFQNLGTAAASTVALSDTLDYRKLDLSTLNQLAAQSHNCEWMLTTTGPNNGLLTVRFLNINLPERNVDVIRSQGFVQFRVRALATLAVGEVIPNHAGIVFDYNAPVVTNTATTTVFLPTATLASHNTPAWEAYPNPATDIVTIAANLATAGQVKVDLLDVLGRPVRQQTLMASAGPLRQTLDLRGLAPGMYVLRLIPANGPATSRQVVHH